MKPAKGNRPEQRTRRGPSWFARWAARKECFTYGRKARRNVRG